MNNKFIGNYLLTLVNTVSGLLLPIITFPYISRVLGAEKLGVINFTTSYGYYFIHLASFGISSYAVREISLIRNDEEKLIIKGNEIYNINIFFSLISGFIYLLGVFFVAKFKENAIVFIIYSLTIFTNFLSLEWLFQAFDDYKFSTIRSLIIRVVSIISVFLFVKKAEDYTIYMFILTISEMGSRLSNLFYAKKRYIKFLIRIKFLNLKEHFKPLFSLFFFRMINGISSNLDKIMLGFFLTYSAVGVYSAGIKIVFLIIPLIENIGIVLFPKINISSKESEINYRRNIILNYNLILLLAIPMSMGLFILSPQIIRLIAGETFEEAIIVSKIMSFVIVLCPIVDLLGSKILLVKKKENLLLISAVVVAVSNIVLNFLFIPLYGIVGATIASLLSYIVSIVIRFLFSYRFLRISLFSKKFFKYLLFSISFYFIYVILKEKINISIYWFMGYVLICVLVFIFELSVSKDDVFFYVLHKLLKRKSNEKNL